MLPCDTAGTAIGQDDMTPTLQRYHDEIGAPGIVEKMRLLPTNGETTARKAPTSPHGTGNTGHTPSGRVPRQTNHIRITTTTAT